MTIWIIEPHDPLIVRDGRPFSTTPGAQAVSLPFPFPSTITGGVRTRAGLKDGTFDTNMVQEVKKIKVRGPLLVQLPSDVDNTGMNQFEWLVPAPTDVLFFDPEEQKPVFQQLVPLLRFEGAMTDFDDKALKFVGPLQPDPEGPPPEPRKPSKEAPLYWYWNMFEKWLLNPTSFQHMNIAFSKLGHKGPQREHRIHVSMELDQRIAKEGALFGTSGLEFTLPGKHGLHEAQRLALAIAVDDSETSQLHGLQEGVACLGGERRMVRWRKSNNQLPPCPQDIMDSIISNEACRVCLLTPAYFAKGYYPTWLVEQRYGVTSTVKAITIKRPQVVSGWDFVDNKPKPTRRLAPAGTVIFLTLKGSNDAIKAWVNSMWMQCMSDNDPDTSVPSQSRDDGFGLAVLGVWSGKPVAMQKE